MSIKLDINKIHITQILKAMTSNLSLYDYLNYLGDSAIQRGANEIKVLAEDKDEYPIHFIDNGHKFRDFISNEGIFLHELHLKAPLLYSSTAFSNFIELSNYVNASNNQKISLNLFNDSQNELKISSDNVDFEYLQKLSESENQSLNCLSLKKVVCNLDDNHRDNFYNFLNTLKNNFTYRYHKLIDKKILKITFLPERKPLINFNPLFENSIFKKEISEIKLDGRKYKCKIKSHVISKNTSKEEIKASCPSGSLEGSCGIFFYNSNNILINKPSYFNLQKTLNVQYAKKENLLKHIKIEICFEGLIDSSLEACRTFLKDKKNKILISNLIEKATKEVDQIIIPRINEKPDKLMIMNSIFQKKIQELRSQELTDDQCLGQLIKLYPNKDHQRIIKEIMLNVN